MTVEEFRKLHPEYKDIEGDQLWNAMESCMLKQQKATAVKISVVPIWKRYRLRWLFYNTSSTAYHMHSLKESKYKSRNRCASCKKGVSLRMGFIFFHKNGTSTFTNYCPHCNSIYIEEKNTNFNHVIYICFRRVINFFLFILDKLHIVRDSNESRYGLFGDETYYVKHWNIDLKRKTEKCLLKKRKWWEYIIIKK